VATKAERTALIFLSAVLVTGAAVRLLRAANGGLRPPPSAVTALERQRRLTDSLARAPREKAAPSRRTGRGQESAARPSPRATNPAPLDPIDVDRASAKEIEALPRIGPALAARIVTEREANGPFLSLEALDKRVKGIGPALAAAIRPFVTFSGR
jgi:competence protein ComEA